ncbi:hypothetical protein LCGC14_0730760 [marine sediment metagenome]|uniref:Uncharacterized protein n=1 Tax=marine sediment metagenome TaxID=412755 RepID=A0A0F9QUJ7_9ZZZZ
MFKLQLIDDMNGLDTWREFRSLGAVVSRAISFVSSDPDRLALLNMPDGSTFGFFSDSNVINIANYSHPGEDIAMHLRPEFFRRREVVVKRDSELLGKIARMFGYEVSISVVPEFA